MLSEFQQAREQRQQHLLGLDAKAPAARPVADNNPRAQSLRQLQTPAPHNEPRLHKRH